MRSRLYMGQSAPAEDGAGACAKTTVVAAAATTSNTLRNSLTGALRRSIQKGYVVEVCNSPEGRHEPTSYTNRFRAGAGSQLRVPHRLHRRRAGAGCAALPVRSRLAEADAQQMEDRRR